MLEKIKETAAFIKAKVNDIPTTAIILGTGLGELVNHIDITDELNYQDIPNFPVSTVEGQRKIDFRKSRQQTCNGYARTLPFL